MDRYHSVCRCSAVLEGNDFLSTGRPLDLNLWLSNLLRGGSNYMPHAISTGLQLGITTTYQRLGLRQEINDATVASTPSVVLDPSYDTHRITGTTTIENIYFITSANAFSTKQFEGVIKR